jgi:hypothetical protein
MSLVRLMLRREDEIFCVPRSDTGKLDLPTRSTSRGDIDGAKAIAALAEAVTGSTGLPLPFGAVRNIVPAPPDTYPWPAPRAHFGIWLIDAAPVLDGSWINLVRPDSLLRDPPLVSARPDVLTGGYARSTTRGGAAARLRGGTTLTSGVEMFLAPPAGC